MNIIEFKEGDIITRNEGCAYQNGVVDGSYLGERLELAGVDTESKIIFLKHLDGIFNNEEPTSLSFARDRWDEGWCKYPEPLWQRIREKFKQDEQEESE